MVPSLRSASLLKGRSQKILSLLAPVTWSSLIPYSYSSFTSECESAFCSFLVFLSCNLRITWIYICVCVSLCVGAVSLQLNFLILNQIWAGLDPTASAHLLLMGNVDPSKIDKIRWSVYVGTLNSQIIRSVSDTLSMLCSHVTCLVQFKETLVHMCQTQGPQRYYMWPARA